MKASPRISGRMAQAAEAQIPEPLLNDLHYAESPHTARTCDMTSPADHQGPSGKSGNGGEREELWLS